MEKTEALPQKKSDPDESRSSVFASFLLGLALFSIVSLSLAVGATVAAAGKCDEACQEHGVCRKGSCWCEKGWVGESCSEEGDNACDMACYGHGRCDAATGVCDCGAGWGGPFCGHQRGEEKGSASGKRATRRAANEAVGTPCPDRLIALPWPERYGVPSGLNRDETLKRLSGCEKRPDPQTCIQALVKLGEVTKPKVAACEFGQKTDESVF